MPVEVTSARIDQIRAAIGNEWAVLRFMETTGAAIITSSFGHWTYFWPSDRRMVSLAHFLYQLDRWYAGSSFLGNQHLVYDLEETARSVRIAIRKSRKSKALDAGEAREEWEKAYLLAEENPDTWLRVTQLEEPWRLIRHVENHAWVAFWQRLWLPEIRPVLEKMPVEMPAVHDHEDALDFWAELGREMLTQEHLGTDYPLYMATEEVRMIETSLTDPDGSDLTDHEPSHRCLIQGAVALTRRGIETWLAAHGKEHRDPQVYVASAHEVPEMRRLIETLTGKDRCEG